MPSPFPGMDPYLESPTYWSSLHSRLIIGIADAIAQPLRPRYYVEVEMRTYWSDGEEEVLVGIPDGLVLAPAQITQVEPERQVATAVAPAPKQVVIPLPEVVKERFLEIREVKTDRVVTVIELLSPKNKQAGEGRTSYQTKRRSILGSQTHLVEIDLLRAGRPMAFAGEDTVSDYRILVSRCQQRPYADFYGFSIRDALPTFGLPLDSEELLAVNLQEIFSGVYERAGYDLRLDYSSEIPAPKLSAANQAWAKALLNL